MIVFDIGNTNISVGFFKNKKIIKQIIFKTKSFKCNSDFIYLIKNIIKKYNLNQSRKLIVLSSVVPNKNIEINKLVKILQWKIINLDNKNIKINIKYKYSLNQKIGSDRLSNSVSGFLKYGGNLIIIDFGTAITFDIIKKELYIGGIILPGHIISNYSLNNYTAKLKKIMIGKKIINKSIGKNTKEAMNIGIYWGIIHSINGIISNIINKNNFKPKIILTGGLARIFKNKIKHKTIYDKNLTLFGLYHIAILNDE